MSRPGWFKVWRRIEDHWLYSARPFNRFQAWMDLLIRANFTDTVIPAPGQVGPATLSPGEAIISLRALEAHWGWSRHRVVRFLETLKKENMIGTTNEHTFTRLKVLNWKKFQGSEVSDGTTDGTTDSPSTGTTTGTTTGTSAGPASAPIRRSKEGEEGKEGQEEEGEGAARAPRPPSETLDALESALGGNGDAPEADRTPSGPTGLLLTKARAAKVPGKPDTLRSYLEAWQARSDYTRVEQILMDPWTRGKTVIEIQDHFFPKEAGNGSKSVGVQRTGQLSLTAEELNRRFLDSQR